MNQKYVKIRLSDGRVIQEGQIEFVIAKNGIFRKIENNVIDGYVKVDNVPFLPELKETVKVKIPRKIPYHIYLQVFHFFRKYETEVYVQIFWNGVESKYFVHIPKQVVGAASVHWKDKESGRLQSKYKLICEIHSHNSMGAFFSATDDDDEKTGIIYGVMSTKDLFESKFRIKIYDAEYDITPNTIFEIQSMVPPEWEKNVKTQQYGQHKQKYLNHGGAIVPGKELPGTSVPEVDEFRRDTPPNDWNV